MLLSRERYRVGGVAILQLIGMAVGYLVQILAARVLDQSAYGLYRNSLSWIMTIAWVATLGFPLSLQRFVPEYKTRRAHSHLRGLLQLTATLPPIVAAILSAAFVCATAFLASKGRALWHDSFPFHLAALLAAPAISYFIIQIHTLRAHRQPIPAYALFYIGRPLSIAIAVLVVVMVGLPALLIPISATILGIAAAILRRTYLRPWLRGPRVLLTQFWLKISLPMLTLTFAGVLTTQMAVLAGSFLFRAATIATISIALQISVLADLPNTALDAVLAPRISDLYYSRQHALLRKTLQRAALASSGLTVVIGSALFVAIPFILHLYGGAYLTTESILLTRLCILPSVIAGLCGLGSTMLNTTGHQSVNALATLIITTITFGGSILAGHLYGPSGLIITYVIGRSLVFLMAAMLAQLLTSFHTSILRAVSSQH